MSLIKTYIIIWIYVGFSFLIVKDYNDSLSNKPLDGFWAMKGILVTHPFINDKIDSLSGQEIYELQDEMGLTIWFCRYIFKDVCIIGQCKMISIWIFWDSAGNYMGFEVPDGEPLTKSDHAKFEPDDYEKLNRILYDTTSILKTLKPEDLTLERVTKRSFEVDGFTAATKPGLEEVVVKNAVYTCHTLWHTVYGQTQKAILDIQYKKINSNYLDKLFKCHNSSNISLAIKSVEKFQEFHSCFYPSIIQIIKSNNKMLSEQALNYFQPGTIKGNNEIKCLIEILPEVSPTEQSKIIWKLSKLSKIEADEILKLLDLLEKIEIGIGNLNIIYQFIQNEHLYNNSRIYQVLKRFLYHENAYVRSLTERLLKEKFTPISD